MFSMFPDSTVKEVDFETASDSTSSGFMTSEHASLPTTPDRFFPPGLADVDSAHVSLQGSLSGGSSTPSESDVETVAVDIYSSPPPGLHPIPVDAALVRPPPGLERVTKAVPSTGMPAPPPELPPISLFSAPAVPEVPAWSAAGASELASERFAFEPVQPVPLDANMSMMGVTNGQPLNPGCEAMFPFSNPVPGWSSCVVSDTHNPDDVSLRIADFAAHHVRENSPDRKRNLYVNGGLQSHNAEGSWQQVPQRSQGEYFNGLEQNYGCQLNGDRATPMWSGCDGWVQDPHNSHNSNLSQPPTTNVTFGFAQQLSSAYNSDMYHELSFHHGLNPPQELYLADSFRHHRHYVDNQEFTEFMGVMQQCGRSQPWY